MLVFLRTYPTYELLGPLFGLHLSNADRLVKKVLPILQEATGSTVVLPKRKRHTLKTQLLVSREDWRDPLRERDRPRERSRQDVA